MSTQKESVLVVVEAQNVVCVYIQHFAKIGKRIQSGHGAPFYVLRNGGRLYVQPFGQFFLRDVSGLDVIRQFVMNLLQRDHVRVLLLYV